MCAYPVAEGTTSVSQIIIPTLWAPGFLAEFYLRTVFAEIANTKYQGQIKHKGDTVRIPILPSYSGKIHDHTIDEDLIVDRVVPTNVDLVIDKGLYFNLSLDYVEQAQSAYKDYPAVLQRHFAQGMKEEIDSRLLSAIKTSGTAGSVDATIDVGSAGSGINLKADADTIISLILDCGCLLDQNSVPNEDRWMVLPARAVSLIKQSSLANVSFSGDNQSIMRNGKWGMVDRFTIYQSNQLYSTGGETYCLYGHKEALTFATQITRSETLYNTKQFGDLMRLLQVYGYEVVKPTAMGTAVVKYS